MLDEDELRQLKDQFDSGILCPLIHALSTREPIDESGECDYMLGDALRQIGRSSEAAIKLVSAAKNGGCSTRFNAQVSLALLLRDCGKFSEAEAVLSSIAIERAHLPGWYWVIRASVASMQEHFHDAVNYLRIAESSADVDVDEVFLNLAYAYRALDQTVESFGCASKVIEMQSSLANSAEEVITSLGIDGHEGGNRIQNTS